MVNKGEKYNGTNLSSVLKNGSNPSLLEILTFQELKDLCWGSASMSPRNIWNRQGITLNPPDQLFAYGINTPKVPFLSNF